MNKAMHSKTVKAGSRTYFIDIKKTSDGRNYLTITESRFKGEGSDRVRASILIFSESAKEFQEALSEMAAHLA
jgi:hypothetical protein